MKSKTYTQSKRPLDKNQSSKFCQSSVKQTISKSREKKEVLFELFFCKKIPLSRRVEYVMGRGLVSESVSESVSE